jgi:hypothetical protein
VIPDQIPARSSSIVSQDDEWQHLVDVRQPHAHLAEIRCSGGRFRWGRVERTGCSSGERTDEDAVAEAPEKM